MGSRAFSYGHHGLDKLILIDLAVVRHDPYLARYIRTAMPSYIHHGLDKLLVDLAVAEWLACTSPPSS